MNNEEKAKWLAMGYKAKTQVPKLHSSLADWEIFRRTFGFYQWKKKNQVTDEQLALFEAGFKHEKQPTTGQT